MTTDIFTLDLNYNSVFEQERVRLGAPEHTIYKNAKRFKHNDIVFLPFKDEINKILPSISELPKRYKNIMGTKRFKEIKDFLLTYNLLQQYFSSHSEDKSLIALDSRYLDKALGSRFINKQNKFFDSFFRREIKGKRGNYTSGFSILKADKVGEYSKVIHKDNLDDVVLKIVNNTYIEEEIKNIDGIKNTKDAPKVINDSFITIPKENIDLLDEFKDGKYKHKINLILSNYKDGKLYYNKDYKPYGRNYSYIHSLPREIRKTLFNGYTEIDLSSAAQTILLRKAQGHVNNDLEYITDYVNNKQVIREKLSKDLNIDMDSVKELIQIVTFNTRVPKIKQVHHFKSFMKYKQCLDNDFIKGLSADLTIIDKYLMETTSNDAKKVIRDFKGKLTRIDVRVYTFQSIESMIMERMQSMLSRESFHLHDAIYVKDISENELNEINLYASKNNLFINNNIILVFKKCQSGESITKHKEISKDAIQQKIILNGTKTLTQESLQELKLTPEEAYLIYYESTPCKECIFISFAKGYKKCICQYPNEKQFYLDLVDKNGVLQGSTITALKLDKERALRGTSNTCIYNL